MLPRFLLLVPVIFSSLACLFRDDQTNEAAPSGDNVTLLETDLAEPLSYSNGTAAPDICDLNNAQDSPDQWRGVANRFVAVYSRGLDARVHNRPIDGPIREALENISGDQQRGIEEWLAVLFAYPGQAQSRAVIAVLTQINQGLVPNFQGLGLPADEVAAAQDFARQRNLSRLAQYLLAHSLPQNPENYHPLYDILIKQASGQAAFDRACPREMAGTAREAATAPPIRIELDVSKAAILEVINLVKQLTQASCTQDNVLSFLRNIDKTQRMQILGEFGIEEPAPMPGAKAEKEPNARPPERNEAPAGGQAIKTERVRPPRGGGEVRVPTKRTTICIPIPGGQCP